jgi:hypothetical protein
LNQHWFSDLVPEDDGEIAQRVLGLWVNDVRHDGRVYDQIRGIIGAGNALWGLRIPDDVDEGAGTKDGLVERLA